MENPLIVQVAYLQTGDQRGQAISDVVNMWRSSLGLPEVGIQRLPHHTADFFRGETSMMTVNLAGTADGGDGQALPFQYSAPETWTPTAKTSMRKLAFEVVSGEQKAEMIVLDLSPRATDFAMNVNFWRASRLNLPPAPLEEITPYVQEMQVDGRTMKWIEIDGTSDDGKTGHGPRRHGDLQRSAVDVHVPRRSRPGEAGKGAISGLPPVGAVYEGGRSGTWRLTQTHPKTHREFEPDAAAGKSVVLQIAWRVLKILASLRLTVTLLAMGIFIVFVGTLAQAKDGLWDAVDNVLSIGDRVGRIAGLLPRRPSSRMSRRFPGASISPAAG